MATFERLAMGKQGHVAVGGATLGVTSMRGGLPLPVAIPLLLWSYILWMGAAKGPAE